MAGVREKKIAIINVKVYALAFYADPTLKDSLPANGAGDAALFKAVADGEFHSILFQHRGLPYTRQAPCSPIHHRLMTEQGATTVSVGVI